MNFKHIILTTLILSLMLTRTHAGSSTESIAPTIQNHGDWCSSLKNMGKVYSNAENPFIQSISFEGRLHYQAMYIDGDDALGNSFNDKADNYRRARLGAKVDFLQYFTTKAVIDVVFDNRYRSRELDWGYQQFDTATLTFDIKKAFSIGALDILELTFGRHKFDLSAETLESSNNILTIERSAIANKVSVNIRPTGFSLQAGKSDWLVTTAIFSSEDDSEFINGGYNDGLAYFTAVDYTGIDQFIFRWDAVINDVEAGEDNVLGYDWATSLNATYEDGSYGILGTLVLGDNGVLAAGRGGSFHGLTVMPWLWIVEDKLQTVFQYSYSGSDEVAGIGANLRYLNGEHNPPAVNVNSGRGDALHTLYAGLNYYLCGNNMKLMGGIEYSDLDTPIGDVDALTYLFGFRVKF